MSKALTIKCGRKTFELEDGETVMDNGSCLQLITRNIGYGFDSKIPRVSKSEFERFKSHSRVNINNNHNYHSGVTLWTYSK